jgi:DnaJ-class molecular chaperone
MWQKCPICNGTGVINNIVSSSSFNKCTTCDGAKIISELTGLPPKLNKKESNDVRNIFSEFNKNIKDV